MKTSKFLALTAMTAGVLALGAAGANAEGYQGSAKAGASISSSKFKALDSDKNGVLSESEYNAAPTGTGSFAQVDANGDGNLTLSELRMPATAPTKAPATGSDAAVGTSANTTTGTSGAGTSSGMGSDSSGSGNSGRQ